MIKHEGFEGQQMIIIPREIQKKMNDDDRLSNLYITDIGYYPNAEHHKRQRNKGSKQYILIYCTKGNGWFISEGKRHAKKAGQYFVLEPNTKHSYGSYNYNSWTIYWIHYSGSKAQSFTKEISKPITVNDNGNSLITQERISIFQKIIKILHNGYGMDNLYFSKIYLELFLASLFYNGNKHLTTEDDEGDKIKESKRYMRENIQHKITLEMIAKHVELSKSHFSNQFKIKTQTAPIDYLIHLRVQKACNMLDNTDFNIKNISEKCGFDDPYYFSRIFSKTMNMSPSKYRKMVKG